MKKIFKPLAILAVLAIAIVGFASNDFSITDMLSGLALASGPLVLAGIPDHRETETMELVQYTGAGDISLEFSGGVANSFLDEIKNTPEFILKITNANEHMKRVLLFPGYINTKGVLTETIKNHTITTATVNIGGTDYEVISAMTSEDVEVIIGYVWHDVAEVNARGLAVDAMIGDEIVATGIHCQSMSKGSIKDFIEYVKLNPTRIPEIIVASNNSLQYGRRLVLKRINPAKDFGETYIGLQKYFQTSQYRNEKITVDTDAYNLQFDNQTLIYLEVEGRVSETIPTQVELTLKLGAAVNTSSWLFNKATIAKEYIRRAGAGIREMIK